MKQFLMLLGAMILATTMGHGVAAQDTYRIKAGDVLRVEVLEDASVNRTALVLPDGSISIPLAGVVPAGGRSIEEVRAELVSRLAPNFAANPTVFVTVDSLSAPVARGGPAAPAKVTIFVLGEVGKPGSVDLEQGTTLLQALAVVGGFSKFAATKRVQLRRKDASGTERVYMMNYEKVLAGQPGVGTTPLASGDVIVVPQRKLFE